MIEIRRMITTRAITTTIVAIKLRVRSATMTKRSKTIRGKIK